MSTLLLILLSITFQTYPQRIKSFSAPEIRTLDDPFKGELFRYYTHHYDINSNFGTNQIDNIEIDKQGRIWYATDGSGFGYMDGEHVYRFGSVNDLYDRFDVIFCDSKGSMWVGGNGVGVLNLKNGNYGDWYIDSTDISDLHIQDIKEDLNGDIWVSTRVNGLSHFTDSSFIEYSHRNQDKRADYVSDLTIDAKNRIWFRIGQKIYYIEEGSVKTIEHLYDTEEMQLRVLGGDHKDYVVGCDWKNRLHKITPNGLELLETKYIEGASEQVRILKNDPDGNLFIGTKNGIYKHEAGIAKQLAYQPLDKFYLSDFDFDKDVGLWA
ncbi:MAG: hypothetical protein ACPG21_00195 [Crocinitomicaceae bacterium]